MSRPMHFKCPNCRQYIKAPVKETRNESDGVFRRRYCEKCGIIIETMETITEYHEKLMRHYTVKYKSDNGYSGFLYGDSSLIVYNPNGDQVLHTGHRGINTKEELQELVDTMPEFMKKLDMLTLRKDETND